MYDEAGWIAVMNGLKREYGALLVSYPKMGIVVKN
jgi:hypothetical protein